MEIFPSNAKDTNETLKSFGLKRFIEYQYKYGKT